MSHFDLNEPLNFKTGESGIAMNRLNNIPTEVDPIECNPEAMSREQRRFFKYWIEELSNGRRVETEDSLTYVSIYLDILAERFVENKSVEYFMRQIDKISEVYEGTEYLGPFLSRFQTDTYLFVNDYDKAWYFLRKGQSITVQDVLDIRGRCKDTTLSGNDLFKIVGNSKTKTTSFGFKHLEALVDDVSAWLSDDYQRDQRNFVERYCKQFDLGTSSRRLFGNHCQIPATFIPSVVVVAVENEIGELFRESENILREKEGLPRIGEGWISETELFRSLQKQFPDEKIVKHAKPSWLTPQHLDIYFPARNIGIEYQGVQHLMPVDYFGGHAAFESQKARDEKKRRLCDKNNCQLMYVYERYELSELIREIQLLLKP